MMILIGCGIGIIFLESLPQIKYQARAINAFLPVEAKIIDKTTNYKNNKKKSFTVKYQYEVDGRQFISDKIFPLFPVPLSYDRFKDIYNKYKNDSLVKAYYSPVDPKKSYLIPEVKTELYAKALMWILLICLILAGYYEFLYCHSKGYYDAKIKNYSFHPEESILKDNFWRYIFIAFIWHFCGISSLCHFLSISKGIYSNFGLVFIIIYESVGLIWLFALIFYKLKKPADINSFTEVN